MTDLSIEQMRQSLDEAGYVIYISETYHRKNSWVMSPDEWVYGYDDLSIIIDNPDNYAPETALVTKAYAHLQARQELEALRKLKQWLIDNDYDMALKVFENITAESDSDD